MAAIREVVERQYGQDAPRAELARTQCEVFAEHLHDELTAERRAELEAQVRRLEPWLQGPFWLGGDVVVPGRWRIDRRWEALGAEVPDDLTGREVLDVGTNAGFDAFMFKKRGAARVVACEPHNFIEQARFLESVYRTGVELQEIGWEQLDAEAMGRFDIVHCNGVLYHEKSPMELLERLRTMVKDDGTLLCGSMMLAEPELAEYARFVPGEYFGDPSWWWVPGRLCLRWMLETAGFHVDDLCGVVDGPAGAFPVISGYLRCRPR
jgi:tRNA (mo5U34)-methyltransferase